MEGEQGKPPPDDVNETPFRDSLEEPFLPESAIAFLRKLVWATGLAVIGIHLCVGFQLRRGSPS